MILLNRHSIEARIEERYASIVYLFDFENLNKNGSNELKFEITIDAQAFISKFEANINGELFVGKTKEKEIASNEYNEAKNKNENAILISKPYDDIPNVFEIKTNVDAKSKILLNITIEQYLQKQFNLNQLNIEILRNFNKYNIIQNYDYLRFTINIKDKSGIYDISIPSSYGITIDNERMDKLSQDYIANGKIENKTSSINELIIKYKIKGEENDCMVLYDAKSNTFCHIICDIITDSILKNENDIDEEGYDDDIKPNILIPRRIVFVIDKSGSMSGGKWKRAISATIMALKQLRKLYDRYCMIFFSNNVKLIPNNAIILANDSNINETISKLQDLEAGGGTNINSPLLQAIDLIKNDIKLLNNNKIDDDDDFYNFYMNQIIFITDGEPNCGERNTKQIISNIKQANNLTNIDKYNSKISIFSFGVGIDRNDSDWIKDLNHSFLKLLSLNNNGFYKRIKQSNTNSALTHYFHILSKPVLLNIDIKYKNKNIKQITKTKFHTLYSGNDIIICGKIDGHHDNQKRINLDLIITAITAKDIKTQNDKAITKPINIYKEMKIDVYPQNDQEKDDNNNNIQRIWAYLKLQDFARNKLIYNDIIEVSDDEKKNDDALPLALAMKYKFVTPWTSMIVVKKKDEITKPKQPKPATPPSIEQEQQNQPHSFPTPIDINDQSSQISFDNLENMRPPFVPQLTNDVDTSNFDSIQSEQDINGASDFKPSKTTDKTHFWGYTFKRPLDINSAAMQKPLPSKPKPRYKNKSMLNEDEPQKTRSVKRSAPTSSSKVPQSQEVLEKVQAMKKRVESTISGRMSDVNQRRLRSLRMRHKLKQNNNNIDDEKKSEILKKYSDEERGLLRDSRKKYGLKDFKLIKVIGKGAFGEVRVIRGKHDNILYAMKTLRKKDIMLKNQVSQVQSERDLMAIADNQWLVKLYYSFQDDTYLYLIMEYCAGGDLMNILIKEDILSEDKTKFYMAELAAAINAVHELDFVHRDLKPDNILITNSGHIKLSDFGLAKHFNTENDEIISKYESMKHSLKESDDDDDNDNDNDNKKKKCHRDRKLMYSTVGTPDYIAPEVFSQKGYDKMVDYWSMGCIMFECLIGYPPFYTDDPLQTCRKIVHYRKYFKIPSDAKLSKQAVDLIHNLICSYRRRYGFQQIKNHSFFTKK